MTDAERDREYRKAQNAILKRRAALLKQTAAEVVDLLKRASRDIKLVLADSPTEYQAWYLPQLQAEIDRVTALLGNQSASVLTGAADEAWSLGQAFVTEPLAAGGLSLVGRIPLLDPRQLLAMRSFMVDRIKDVSAVAASAIKSELGMVVIGARPISDAIGNVQKHLGGASRTRATTIVRTEVSRVFGVAANERIQQAVADGVEMDKVWRRSGKLHPRVSHALADGQRVAYDQPFLVGGVAIMYPHDPAAPASHTINCGCVMIPRPRGWASTKPDHKPFTEDELRRNPKLRAIVEGKDGPTLRELSGGAGVAGTVGKKAAGAAIKAASGSVATEAYTVAKAGGAHAGYLSNYYDLPDHLIQKAIRSTEKQIANHEAWIANPATKLKDLSKFDAEQVRRYVDDKWPADIKRQREHVSILEGILKEREHGKD
ncbi:MAG: hypothetical protein IPG66_05870 [Hydrogenophilales bacterium]|nr:hypothetical protein [Hydrogenophilales bacterium]